MDIVERLRSGNPGIDKTYPQIMKEAADKIDKLEKERKLFWDAFQKAANEIERLREALQKMEASRSEWSTGVGERVVYYAGKIKKQANEIERLREALQEIVKAGDSVLEKFNSLDSYCLGAVKNIARSALQQKESE